MTDATKILQKCLKSFSSSSRPTWYIRARKLSYVLRYYFKISRIRKQLTWSICQMGFPSYIPLTGNCFTIHKHLFQPHDDLNVRTSGYLICFPFSSFKKLPIFCLGVCESALRNRGGRGDVHTELLQLPKV